MLSGVREDGECSRQISSGTIKRATNRKSAREYRGSEEQGGGECPKKYKDASQVLGSTEQRKEGATTRRWKWHSDSECQSHTTQKS